MRCPPRMPPDGIDTHWPACKLSGMSQFTRTGITNLIRHRSGNYYLEVKVRGVKIRRCLNTRSKDLARHLLPEKIKTVQADALRVMPMGSEHPATVLGYLAQWRARQMARVDIEESTKGNYLEISKWLERRFPEDAEPKQMAVGLWEEVAGEYAPSPANNIGGMLKAIAEEMVKDGHLLSNPFAGIAHLKARRAIVEPLSIKQVLAVIESIRKAGRHYSEESADFVQVLAFSGLRVGQVRGLVPGDVGAKNLSVRSGVTGSKGADARRLPLNRHLEPVLRKRVAYGCNPLFTIHSPREALNNATRRLGLPKQRVHDLRHFFATHCIELGVDVPTLSRWLGHRDGGALAMRTYGHLRDEHSQAMAARI